MNLLADVGGYAGIFIGASVLTIHDLITELVVKIKVYIEAIFFRINFEIE